MAWVLGSAGLANLFRPRRERPLTFPMMIVVSWSGMRGILSLAAALAIPHAIGGGKSFPARDLIVFLTFSAIVITLLVQAVTLRPLMRAIGLENDAAELPGETAARREMAVAALKALRRSAREATHGAAAAAALRALTDQYRAEAPTDVASYDPAARRRGGRRRRRRRRPAAAAAADAQPLRGQRRGLPQAAAGTRSCRAQRGVSGMSAAARAGPLAFARERETLCAARAGPSRRAGGMGHS